MAYLYYSTRRRKKACLFTLLMVLTLSVPSVSLSSQAGQEITVTLDEGSFTLKDFALKDLAVVPETGSLLTVSGYVVNNTIKDWTRVVFGIDFYDEHGNKLRGLLFGKELAPFTFVVHDIKKGQSKKIIAPLWKPLTSGTETKKPNISTFTVRFKEGSYPAKYTFVMTAPTVSRDLAYEDAFLIIQFYVAKEEIGFTLFNKTDNPLKIDWNQVSYVDYFGTSHRVIHSGVKYIDRAKPQPPTIVPPKAKLTDLIFPSDLIRYESEARILYGWRRDSLFPDAPLAKDLKGQTFRIFMPIEVSGTVRDYYFSFKIEEVEF